MDIEARLEYIIFENKANHYVVAGFSELKTYHNFTAAGISSKLGKIQLIPFTTHESEYNKSLWSVRHT